MPPYRSAPPAGDDDSRATPLEEWLVAGALVALGGVRVAIAIATREPFGAEVTLAAVLGALGAFMLVRAL